MTGLSCKLIQGVKDQKLLIEIGYVGKNCDLAHPVVRQKTNIAVL